MFPPPDGLGLLKRRACCIWQPFPCVTYRHPQWLSGVLAAKAVEAPLDDVVVLPEGALLQVAQAGLLLHPLLEDLSRLMRLEGLHKLDDNLASERLTCWNLS